MPGGESPRRADGARAEEPRSSHRLALRGFVLLATGGVAVHGLHAAGAFDHGVARQLVDDWLYCGLYALAAAACLRHALVGDARLAWAAATMGVIVWGGAEVVFRLAEPSPRAWYPAASQAMLLVGFCLAYTTLILLARARVRRLDPLLALDGMIAGAGGASVAAALIFQPLAGAPAVTGSSAPAPGVYLAGAVLGMAFVITVVGLTGWRPGRVWSLIAVAIGVNTIGDVVLVREVAAGEFHRGSIADTLFVASALLLGLAAFYPGPTSPVVPRRAQYLPIPIGVAVVAIAVLIAASVSDVGAVAVSLAAIALSLTLIRMAVALRLLERSRREALTDGLTGLGNRQKLYGDLGRLLASAPARRSTLTLFDLNGFKRYNDTFGHLSGDAILARLADRLATAIAPAQAYRMGGDEFCLLVEGTGSAAQAIVAIAHGALEEHGDGFSVTNCYGVVTLPDDARDVHSALAMADARMYAQKALGQSPGQRQAPDAVLQVLGERGPPLRSQGRDVAQLAAGVARRLGLDPAQVDEVYRAAELHDIGKMAVPDDILCKPGPLDDVERRFIRQHVTVGERMLRAAPSLARLAPVVRSSHERWDGSGYPDGLAGDEIPLGARIIAGCDAYRAMCSRRPHSEAMTSEQSLQELRRCAGSQFDPQVVAAIEAEVQTRADVGGAERRQDGVLERERRDSNPRPPA